MLHEFLPFPKLKSILEGTRPSPEFPPASDRAAWETMMRGDAQKIWCGEIVSHAEEILGQPWSDCSFALLLDYTRKNSRVAYETPYFERRARLAYAVLAECIEHKGRFMEEICEGIWHILSEPFWCLPAHEHYAEGDPTPLPGLPVVDLFASATGSLLADMKMLLGTELNAFSASLMKRVEIAVMERVVAPMENAPERAWWINGYNNWSVWCSYNVADSAMVFLEDRPERLAKLLDLLLTVTDRFLGNYSPDGGCDEGPAYWGVAAAKMFLFADLVNWRTGVACADFFSLPLIRNMGEYFPKVNLCGDWFMNPADAPARIQKKQIGVIFRYGELTGSSMMKEFAIEAAYGMNPGKGRIAPICGAGRSSETITFLLRDLFWTPNKLPKTEIQRPACVFLPDLQCMVIRENTHDTNRGTVAAIKGGCNGESHNHNDVGQFTIFRNGCPLIIDPGNMSYNRLTFSDSRYKFWHISALGHNAAQFNGIIQPSGKEYYAKVLESVTDGPTPGLLLDLTKAYPAEAGISAYTRHLTLDRANGIVEVSEKVLSGKELNIRLFLYSPVNPAANSTHSLAWPSMRLAFSGIAFAGMEEITLDDPVMNEVWGTSLFRLIFETKSQKNAEWNFRFLPEKG